MPSNLPKRKKMRLPDYDYAQPGAYFITICAKNRRPLFSSVRPSVLPAESLELTALGKLVDARIKTLSSVYPNVSVDHYVVMPNHVHLLLRLHAPEPSGAAGCPPPTVSKIISALKSLTSRDAALPLWHRGFYDHVVRDEADYLRIWKYIDDNPANWDKDEYFLSHELSPSGPLN